MGLAPPHLDRMSLDFAYLRTHMPIIDTIMEIMLAVGWALLIGNLVFQAVKDMVTGLGFEAEDPKLLFTRTFVFAFLLLASPQICRIGLDMTSTVIELLDMPDAVNITFADEADIVFITDGECVLSEECLDVLHREEAERKFKVTGVLLDTKEVVSGFSLEPFCQQIYRTSQFLGDEVVRSILVR